jgi:hypothetical protein
LRASARQRIGTVAFMKLARRPDRVRRRFDALEEALGAAGLTAADEVRA